MLNKKRIIAIVAFLALSFTVITLAGGREQLLLFVIFTDSYDDSIISEQRVEDGADAVVPEDPYHEDYVFAGWYLSGEEDTLVTDFTNITNDLRVEARYKVDLNNNGIADEIDTYYTVYFEDGVTGEVLKTQTVLNGMNATAPVALSHNGYSFIGWSQSFNIVNSNLNILSVYESTNVVAGEEETTCTLSFFDRSNVIFSTQSVRYGLSSPTIENVPVYTGYTLEGWYDQTNGLGSPYYEGSTIYSDKNIYGYWVKTKYMINVIASGGDLTDAESNNVVEYLDTFILPDATKTYTLTLSLDGGYLESGGSTIIRNATLLGYCLNAEICDISVMKKPGDIIVVEENATYYAVWGSADTNITLPEVLKDSSVSTNYKFAGWSSIDGGEVEKNSGDSILIDGNEILYSVFNESDRLYDYEIDTNGGTFNDTTFVNPQEIVYAENVILPYLSKNYIVKYKIAEDEMLG